MIDFFTSNTFLTVVAALNTGFLKTLQLFFITLIGALPLGLIISFGSMSRFFPLRWLTRTVVWVVRGTPLVLRSSPCSTCRAWRSCSTGPAARADG